MSLISSEKLIYTVLDMNNAFFSLPLAQMSQPIFVLELTDYDG